MSRWTWSIPRLILAVSTYAVCFAGLRHNTPTARLVLAAILGTSLALVVLLFRREHAIPMLVTAMWAVAGAIVCSGCFTPAVNGGRGVAESTALFWSVFGAIAGAVIGWARRTYRSQKRRESVWADADSDSQKLVVAPRQR
jgi:hypothetical protein